MHSASSPALPFCILTKTSLEKIVESARQRNIIPDSTAALINNVITSTARHDFACLLIRFTSNSYCLCVFLASCFVEREIFSFGREVEMSDVCYWMKAVNFHALFVRLFVWRQLHLVPSSSQSTIKQNEIVNIKIFIRINFIIKIDTFRNRSVNIIVLVLPFLYKLSFYFLISEMKYLVYPFVCRRSYAIWCSVGHWSFSAAKDRLLKLAPINRIIFKNLFAGRVCEQRKNLFC